MTDKKPGQYIATFKNGQYLTFTAENIGLARDHARHVAKVEGLKLDCVDRTTGLNEAMMGKFTANFASLFQ